MHMVLYYPNGELKAVPCDPDHWLFKSYDKALDGWLTDLLNRSVWQRYEPCLIINGITVRFAKGVPK